MNARVPGIICALLAARTWEFAEPRLSIRETGQTSAGMSPLAGQARWRSRAGRPRHTGATGTEPLLLFPRRKSKHEKRLFICERRLRNPHAPRFSAPKTFRGAVTQYLPSRAYRLFTGSLEVREFHSFVVGFETIIFYMEIVSGHDSAPILLAGALVSLCHRRQGGTAAGDQ